MGSCVGEQEMVAKGKREDFVEETEEEEEESEDDTVYLNQELPVREPADTYYEDVRWFATTTIGEMRAIQDTLARQARKYPSSNRFFRVNKPAHIVKAAAASKLKPTPTLPYKLWVKHSSSKTSAAGCTAARTWLPLLKPLSPPVPSPENNNTDQLDADDSVQNIHNHTDENTKPNSKQPTSTRVSPTVTDGTSQECTVPSVSPSSSPTMSENQNENTRIVTSDEESDTQHKRKTSSRLSSRRPAISVPSIKKPKHNPPITSTKYGKTSDKAPPVKPTPEPTARVSSAKPTGKPHQRNSKSTSNVKTHTRWSALKPATPSSNHPGRNGRKHPNRSFRNVPSPWTARPITKNTKQKSSVPEKTNKGKAQIDENQNKQTTFIAKKSHKKHVPSNTTTTTTPDENNEEKRPSPGSSSRGTRARKSVRIKSTTEAPYANRKIEKKNIHKEEKTESGQEANLGKNNHGKSHKKREREIGGEDESVPSMSDVKKRACATRKSKDDGICETHAKNEKTSRKAKGYYVVSGSEESGANGEDCSLMMSADALLEMATNPKNDDEMAALLEVLSGPRQKRSCRR